MLPTSSINKKTRNKKSWRFWFLFWIISAILLFTWHLSLELKRGKVQAMLTYGKQVTRFFSLEESEKEKLTTTLEILENLSKRNSSLLVLFQDPDELRPTGGKIEALGILKIEKNEIKLKAVQSADSFNKNTKPQVDPAYPFSEYTEKRTSGIEDLLLSDDFSINAEKIKSLYDKEELVGVVTVSLGILPSILEITGPTENDTGQYTRENITQKIQYQFETDPEFEEFQKIITSIAKNSWQSDWSKKKKLTKRIAQALDEKEILLNFENEEFQEKIEKLSWAGKSKSFKSDYLMMVDTNLFSSKTDGVIKRTFDYTVDFSTIQPKATLKITYENNGRVHDWLTDDYTSYFQVYVPVGSWLLTTENLEGDVQFEEKGDKKYFGGIVKVPLGKSKTVSLSYSLPESVKEDNYSLLIQKQPGVNSVQGQIKKIVKDRKGTGYEVKMKKDWEFK